MRRIDDPSAVPVLPVPEASGNEGFFTEGVPGVTPATLVRASWLNMIQEELRSIVVAAGIVPSKTVYTQLLTALRSAGVFTTASLGDGTTKVATTDFVQKNGLKYGAIMTLTANTALTSSALGKAYNVSGSVTITLPPLATSPAGSTITFNSADSTTQTIAASGAELIAVPGLPQSNSISFKGFNRSIILVSDGATGWYGSNSNLLAFLSATNGYRQMPDGTIEQWGQVATLATGSMTVSFPIPFPSICYGVNATPYSGSGPRNTSVMAGTPTNNNFTLAAFNSATGAMIAEAAFWRATGK